MTFLGSILSVASVVVATSFVFASTSFSACPVSSDLEKGITLTRTNPFYASSFMKKDDLLLEKRIMSRGGEAEQVSYKYHHALIVSERISANETLTAKYDGHISELGSLRDR